MNDIELFSSSNVEIIPKRDNSYQKDNLIGAENDFAAVSEWLRKSASSSEHTLESYSREARRLVVYCHVIGKTFADLNSSDINNFYDLLLNPPSDWIVPITTKKKLDTPLKPTQLLRGKLSKTSLAQTKTILKGLFNYLNDAGYVKGNCVALAQNVKKTITNTNYKALSVAAWAYLEKWMDEQVANADDAVQLMKAYRDRWLIHLIYHTGMRKSSVVSSMMSCIHPKEINGVRYLHITFTMKGDKQNTVLLSEEVIERLKEYRVFLGLPELPSSAETDIPLVHSLNHSKKIAVEPPIMMLSGSGITSDGLTTALKKTIESAKADCEDEWILLEISSITPHTFRHTCATHRLLNGASIESTQDTLGHSNIQTTMIYSHIQDEMLLSEQQKVSKNRKSRKLKD